MTRDNRSPLPSRQPPAWEHCGRGADPFTNPVGCRGIHVNGHSTCLAHLRPKELDAHLEGLRPGADLDHRGTPFTEALLQRLLDRLGGSANQAPRIGTARFGEATFTETTSFHRAMFEGIAEFDWATFKSFADFNGTTFAKTTSFDRATFEEFAGFDGTMFKGIARFNVVTFEKITRFNLATFGSIAVFRGATFESLVDFDGATFEGHAAFDRARFRATAGFDRARFEEAAGFHETRFQDVAGFDSATFTGAAQFYGATFDSDAQFRRATFKSNAEFYRAKFTGPFLGPLLCLKMVALGGAVFKEPVTVEIAATEVGCRRTRWVSTANLRLRYATIDLTDAVLSAPVAITAHPASFKSDGPPMNERLLAQADPGVRVSSVRGVDAAHLVLTDTDLHACSFSGAFHLDQLRLEGRCTFAPVPTRRWTRRRTLAEENHWRAATTIGNPDPPKGWQRGSSTDRTPQPAEVAAIYRQLRKTLEDSKNEPGAADFYYGEMEMRRHDTTGTPRMERILLSVYWLLSGYGLRATRALGWLLVTMMLTVGLLMAFGLPPAPGPTQQSTLTVRPIGLTTAPVDPSGAVPGDWFTQQRLDRATRTALNSVVFRSAGEGLTTVGTYIEMVSRFLEPILLVLALLAVRNRVKR